MEVNIVLKVGLQEMPFIEVPAIKLIRTHSFGNMAFCWLDYKKPCVMSSHFVLQGARRRLQNLPGTWKRFILQGARTFNKNALPNGQLGLTVSHVTCLALKQLTAEVNGRECLSSDGR